MNADIKKIDKRKEAQQLLVRLWPDVFDFKKPRPLKIGIINDMMESIKDRGIPILLRDIKFCLRTYTLRVRYQKCLIKGGYRYDLNGEPCGIVTLEQEMMARNTLQNMMKKRNQ